MKTIIRSLLAGALVLMLAIAGAEMEDYSLSAFMVAKVCALGGIIGVLELGSKLLKKGRI
ncbi:MAG: hypothetical protein K2M87_05055 [Muribaculaceae bacterium]|nr:hypothetical protein [Muribaculaceae bacterium]